MRKHADIERMGKKREKKIQLQDIFVTVLCLTGATLAFLFFLRDLNNTLTKVNESPVGSVHYKYKIAQRRFRDRLVWDMLKQDSPVYSGDVLHTAAMGEASITFRGGAAINLSENSLVQIFDTPEGARVEISSGKIDVNTGSEGATLRLVQGGAEVFVAAGSVVSTNSRVSGGAAIQVLEGSAEVVTPEGVRQEALAGQALSLSEMGVPETSPIVTMTAPSPNRQLISQGGPINVDFAWTMQNFGPADRVRFEIAADRRFTRLADGATLSGQSGRTVALAPGSYWWRAYPLREGASQEDAPEGVALSSPAAAEALTSKLSIIASVKPILLNPQNDSVVGYRGARPQVRFQWRSSSAESAAGESASDWRLTVSSSSAFTNPLIMQIVRENSFTATNLEPGRWYWRVEPVLSTASGTVESGDAEVAAFTIEKVTGRFLPAELNLPADGAFINISAGAPPVNFIWRNEPEAEVYRLTVARDAAFTQPVLSREQHESRFTYQNRGRELGVGTYFWRVSWADAEGVEAPVSSARSFTALEGTVIFENVSPADNWVTPASTLGQTRFSWRTNLGAAGRLQIAPDAAFSSVLIELPSDSGGNAVTGVTRTEGAAGLQLPLGNYYWRVTGVASGNGFSTTPRHFEVRRAARVVLQSPANRAELDGLEVLRTPLVLNWDTDDSLLSSRLILSRQNPPDQGTPIFAVNNPGRNVSAPPLDPGVYYWTVKAETREGIDVSAAAPFMFTVKFVAQLPAAVLTLPTDGATINSEQLRQNRRIDFAWNAVRGANAYILSIYRQDDDRRAAPVFTSSPVQATRYSLTGLEVLDVGGFVWQIEPVAQGATGRIEQRGAFSARRFSINISIPEAARYPDEETYGMPEQP